jgi:hypothetical protein
MSVWDKDASFDDSTPFELITIDLLSSIMRYTTYPEDVTIAHQTYKAIPIKHDNPEYEIFKDDANCDISVPYTEELANYFINGFPFGLITAEIRYVNKWVDNPKDFVLNSDDYFVIWKGNVNAFNCQLPWFTLSTTNLFSSTARMGVRRHYSRSCPYQLYGSSCRASKADYAIYGTVNVYSGNTLTLTSAGMEPGKYRGGYCQYTHAVTGFTMSQFVINNDAHTVVLGGVVRNPMINGPCTVYQGCNHTVEDCISRFNNLANCGAFPLIPVKKPFGGSTNNFF